MMMAIILVSGLANGEQTAESASGLSPPRFGDPLCGSFLSTLSPQTLNNTLRNPITAVSTRRYPSN